MDETERGVTPADLTAVGFSDGEEIGRGGFGVVYRCRQADLDRTVAVKVLTGALDADSRERFLREQRAMGAVSGHPHICNILQVGATRAGRPFIVMPYHRNNSLQDLIRRTGPLDWRDVATLGTKMAGALETAHRSGILHRDVKPGNILLTEYGEPQLADFGIARTAGGFETGTGHITGSPAYTAPEVLDGRSPSARSDIYSLGATLFCALTGHAASERRDGEHVVAQFLRVTDAPVPDLRGGDIPDDLCAAIESAMASDPRDRPPDAAAFGLRLQQVAGAHGLGTPEMALPMAPPDRAAAGSDPPALTRARTDTALRSRRGRPPPTPATRFRAPLAGRTLVDRDRLVDRLRGGERRRLTVIHAPAGFGKTTLAAQWGGVLTEAGVTVAWLTVAPDDDNVVWFLTHLVEAIRRAAPDIADDLDQVLEDHGSDAGPYVLSTLINRIHESRHHIVLVIDDWHRVTDPGSHAVLAYLLDNGCHHLQVVVTSRATSGLPLARMRVQDELVEIDASELRFDDPESRQLLVGLGGLDLSDSDVSGLRRSTDGWAAALQLASLSLRHHDDPGDLIEHLAGQQAVDEFLTENVLDTLEPDLLDFLLATSITERITGSLASALTGVPNGRARLEEVASRDLFLSRLGADTPVSTSTGPIDTWFRYHHLFATHLRRRLERDHPERLTTLHRTASAWFADRFLLREAVDHALAAGDTDVAVRLVERDGGYLIEHSRMAALLALVDTLPPAVVVTRPRLELAMTWANTLLQRLEPARHALTLARVALESTPDDNLSIEADVVEGAIAAFADHPVDIERFTDRCLEHPDRFRPWVLTAVANIRAYGALYRFDFDGVRRWLDWAAPHHEAMRGPFNTMYAYCLAGIAANEELAVEVAEDWFRRALRAARDASGPRSHSARLAAVMLGELLYERNHLDEAERLLDEGFEVGGEGGIVEFMIARYVTAARIKYLRGDPDAAAVRLTEGARTADTLGMPRLRARIDNERVRLGFPITMRTRTPRHPGLPPAADVTDGAAEITAQLEDATTARLLVRSGTATNAAAACEIAQAWTVRLTGTGRARALLQADRLLVTCLFAAGRDDDALATLASAAARCGRHSMIRYLLDGGPSMVAGLAELRDRAVAGRWEPSWSTVPIEFLDDMTAAGHVDRPA